MVHVFYFLNRASSGANQRTAFVIKVSTTNRRIFKYSESLTNWSLYSTLYLLFFSNSASFRVLSSSCFFCLSFINFSRLRSCSGVKPYTGKRDPCYKRIEYWLRYIPFSSNSENSTWLFYLYSTPLTEIVPILWGEEKWRPTWHNWSCFMPFYLLFVRVCFTIAWKYFWR